MYQLRNYQVTPSNVGVSYFKGTSSKPSLIICPTAFGKSLLIADIANKLEDKTLVLQPSKELLAQNYEKLIGMGGEASIYSASFKTKEFGDKITYATIGSIKSLGEDFKKLGYTNLIIDEVHLFPREVNSMLGKFLKASGITKVLGLTASAFKLQSNWDMAGNTYSKLVMLTNKSKKGNFFKDILHVTQIEEIVTKGYWSKLIYQIGDFDASRLKLNTTKAEFTEESIMNSYNEQNIQNRIEREIENSDRKSILVFVPSVIHAIMLANNIPNSVVIHGRTENKERDRIINDFKSLKIRVVINVNVLSVGFDHPELDMIICGRSTASLAWWYQAAGRGTRIHPNKKDCLIVDFAGNVDRFGKLEDLIYREENGYWKLYGTGGKLLTGVPISGIMVTVDPKKLKVGNSIIDFGKHKGKMIKEIPATYLKWMVSESGIDFKPHQWHLVDEINAVLTELKVK